MSSKTQLNEYIKNLKKLNAELQVQKGKLIKDLDWANTQIGMGTVKLKQYKERPWWKKLFNIY